MYRSQRFKPLLARTPLQPNPFPSTFSLKCKFTSLAPQHHSFTVSYLINNCAFSPETALKASERVRFDTAEKPDSVIAFFRNNGFSNSQINSIFRRIPDLLTCNPHKRVLPKFQFLASKGASNSDIVQLVNRCPRLLTSSLENNVIPTFELNVNMLVDVGVRDSDISYLFRKRPSILLSNDLKRTVDEVKEMGFDPLKIVFVMALHAKRGVSKLRWDAKVDAFKSWGWSEEVVLDTFRKNPLFMLMSKDKINEVMRFCVDELGWDPLALAKWPTMFGYSLEGRIIPRGLVVRYLIAKGLRGMSANLFTPFNISEELFLENYVTRFKKEKPHLLKLYKKKRGSKKTGITNSS
ncbi:uncharacterized protein LOC109803418 isoform X1 [Cajanus cajan]|uniref:uncharacterized protein LOC109803418 isoform X1 n=1 Tax=Cajanus cajan TaxID=3821 RepID=UPI00098D8CDA|nr:uncharacterized protein LOC109803418 isoform X1 [Cajanus cajan]